MATSSGSNARAQASTSTRRAAKLAQKGKGRKVRFQHGTFFPLAVALVLALGLLLVVYARESREVVAAPTVDDHWHHSYGFYLCDTWVTLTGAAEESDASGLLNQDYARTGVHSHDDGVIHWHAFSNAATGSRSRLKVFLDVYDVELTDSKLTFPASQLANMPAGFDDGVFEEGETKCVIDGEEEDASLRVVTWDNFSDEDSAGKVSIANLDDVRFDQDAMAVTIAFLPDNVDVTKPPSAPDLPTLAQSDTNQARPEDFVEGETGTDESETGDTGPADSIPVDTAAPDSAADTDGG